MALLAHSWRQLCLLLEMIKFEHTVFALPFALIGMLLAADGLPPPPVLGWIVVAMVGARSSAMAFNRLVDLEIDRHNPRTAGRALPAGLLSSGQAWGFTFLSAALLVLAASRLNRTALALAPVALAIVWGYSFTKRFTALSHLVLGFAIGIAPSAAWIAVRGTLEPAPLVLTLAVMGWVGGFDIIYSLQDEEFDRRMGLHSLPARLGAARALWLSRALHVATVALLLWLPRWAPLGAWYYAGVAATALLLAYEQTLVKPNDLSRVNAAFFTVNGFVSLGLLAFTAIDLAARGRF
mgnify:CR=1 FL=1